ncbi:ABC transporter ATP-binding protein [Anaerolentibacter hominis]|uniref:ABC transporter ATP-binding protein n=1 Tax=Anaerolentibacter hominis TaxID=3079009 RepID=UPI0031B843B4
MNTVVKAENLTKYYKRGRQTIKALYRVNLEIEEGQFTAVVGPSGSGKTTLLRLLSTLDSPSEGRVILDGIEITGKKNREIELIRREKVGFVFQSYDLFAEYTVFENIILPIMLSHKIVNTDFIDALMDSLGITKIAKAFPIELSGGEMQRVAIARALANRPAVIFADEPTAQLDSENSRRIVELLHVSGQMWNQTILMVTHNMELSQYADEIIHLKDGELYLPGEQL